MVHKAEAVIKKDERKNISEGLRFAIVGGNQKGAKNGSNSVGRKTLSSSLSPFLYLRDAV